MNYVLALFLPPLSILLAGRPIVAFVTLLIWIPAILLSGGLTHPVFILLAWILDLPVGRGTAIPPARRLTGPRCPPFAPASPRLRPGIFTSGTPSRR